jgi:hypothetical protein
MAYVESTAQVIKLIQERKSFAFVAEALCLCYAHRTFSVPLPDLNACILLEAYSKREEYKLFVQQNSSLFYFYPLVYSDCVCSRFTETDEAIFHRDRTVFLWSACHVLSSFSSYPTVPGPSTHAG